MKKRKKKLNDKHNNNKYLSLSIDSLIKKVNEFAKPLCESENIELVYIEYIVEQKNHILRILIDKQNGVQVEDCVNISRQLSDILDVNLEEFNRYRLEVSSPGLERPLVKENDFIRFKGNKIKIKTKTPLNGQRNFKGILGRLNNNNVELTAENKEYSIPFNIIMKARIISDFGE